MSRSLTVGGQAVLTLIVGLLIANWAHKLIVRALFDRKHLDQTLVPIFAQAVRFTIMIIVGIAVLDRFGVTTTSIIAVLGAAGIAIGLALQGTLSNIAAGIMLIIMRPMRVGEYVDAGQASGTVKAIGLFTCEFERFDGVYLSVPNTLIWNTQIINYTRNPRRRADVPMGISYQDDIDGARTVLLALMAGDSRIAKTPPAEVLVTSLDDSAVTLTMRCWTSNKDYWAVLFDLNRAGKLQLEANGFSIPFPQRDVHLIHAKPTDGPKPKTPANKKKPAVLIQSKTTRTTSSAEQEDG